MKLFVLDENGRVIFEFAPEGGGYSLASSDERRAKVITLMRAAVKFLMREKSDEPAQGDREARPQHRAAGRRHLYGPDPDGRDHRGSIGVAERKKK